MKTTHLYLCLLATLLLALPSCKKDSWLDWKAQNEAWLVNNALQDSVFTTPTGLQYKVLLDGEKGPDIKPDNLKTVNMTYRGRLINGNTFDYGNHTDLQVGTLISGFAEGVKMMRPTAHYELYIPANLGYGSEATGTEGVSGYIPPYSTLIFDVTLHAVY